MLLDSTEKMSGFRLVLRIYRMDVTDLTTQDIAVLGRGRYIVFDV